MIRISTAHARGDRQWKFLATDIIQRPKWRKDRLADLVAYGYSVMLAKPGHFTTRPLAIANNPFAI